MAKPPFLARILAASFACVACTLSANSLDVENAPEVTILGTFHFNNPGLDVVKNEVMDVMKAPQQAVLDTLATRLAKRAPKAVLIECTKADEAKLNQEFQAYLKGKFALKRNENYGYPEFLVDKMPKM